MESVWFFFIIWSDLRLDCIKLKVYKDQARKYEMDEKGDEWVS